MNDRPDADDGDTLPELLTTPEVARLFRVSPTTVHSWAYRGLLPFTTTPTGKLRFYRDTVEEFLKERDVTTSRAWRPQRRRPPRDE